MNLSLIVAIAQNNAIGKSNTLLWRISEDLKHFKTLTMGKTIIMGRKTFESLPNILSGRFHIVISKTLSCKDDTNEVKIISSIDELPVLLNDNEAFVIGGGQIYKELLPYVSKLYLTHVYSDFNADTFFPQINKNEWTTIEKSELMTDPKNGLKFSYETLVRK